jgi:signal transduction histidine kinase
VKFSHFEGVVAISCFRKNRFIYIFVIDNGVGITPEDLEKIKRGILFSNKGTNHEKGTGLGLSLCQNLLQKCDASLDIESAFGRGTGVSIKIPAKYVVEAKQTVASTQDLSAD